MSVHNAADRFGWISRLLHWGMAIGLIVMLGFGLWLEELEPSLSNIWLFGLHKSIGLTLLALALIRLVWHWYTQPPAPQTTRRPWQQRAARVVHKALYALMLAVPLTGWVASSATGIGTEWFDLVPIPAIAPTSEQWEAVFFAAHGTFTKVLISLIILHVGAALYHALVLKDGALRRMISGGN